MAYINFYSIVSAVYSAEDKTVSIYGTVDLTGDIYQLLLEGTISDFCDRKEEVYKFDLTNRAEFNYCLRWVNKNLEEDQRSLSFKEKLDLLAGKVKPEVLVDNETVRVSYAQYWQAQERKQKAEKKSKKSK